VVKSLAVQPIDHSKARQHLLATPLRIGVSFGFNQIEELCSKMTSVIFFIPKMKVSSSEKLKWQLNSHSFIQGHVGGRFVLGLTFQKKFGLF